jgi:hypothetical protein
MQWIYDTGTQKNPCQTCQKPLHRAIERDESLVRQWLEKKYPKILAMVKIQGMDIYFGDAARIHSWRRRHRQASKALGHVPLIDRDFRGQHEAKAECAEEVARMKFTAVPEPDDALYELRIMVERVNGDGRMNSAAGSCVCAARSR